MAWFRLVIGIAGLCRFLIFDVTLEQQCIAFGSCSSCDVASSQFVRMRREQKLGHGTGHMALVNCSKNTCASVTGCW